MKPTVGRIVHYGWSPETAKPGSTAVETIAAIVAGVLPDYGTQPVNLYVLPNGPIAGVALPQFIEGAVYGTAEDGLSPKIGCWCWPPKVN